MKEYFAVAARVGDTFFMHGTRNVYNLGEHENEASAVEEAVHLGLRKFKLLGELGEYAPEDRPIVKKVG